LKENPNSQITPQETMENLAPATTLNKAEFSIEKQYFRWEKAFAVTKRTAEVGLLEAALSDENKAKWLLIWSCDIVGELGEAIYELEHSSMSTAALTEIGDIIWGVSAICLLLEIEPGKLINCSIADEFDVKCAIVSGCEILDLSKKICRDTISKRPINLEMKQKYINLINSFLFRMVGCFDFDKALGLVDAKLLARYPNGYTPEASVNRVV
jgi:NTP pyrophosphatase (non-canonical NTP hydrolase)